MSPAVEERRGYLAIQAPLFALAGGECRTVQIVQAKHLDGRVEIVSSSENLFNQVHVASHEHAARRRAQEERIAPGLFEYLVPGLPDAENRCPAYDFVNVFGETWRKKGTRRTGAIFALLLEIRSRLMRRWGQ